MSKIDQLCEIEGLDIDELMNEQGMDSVLTGICTNEDCDYSTGVEPDCRNGYCENCGTQTVQSWMSLLGII